MKKFRTMLLAGLCMAASSISNAGDFYVQINLGGGSALLATVDLTTGEAIPVSLTPEPRTLAFDFPDIGTTLIGTANGKVVTWDYLTGTATVGPAVSQSGGAYKSLAIDSSNTVFVLNKNAVVATLDPATGVTTGIGNIGISPSDNGMDFAPDGTLYFITAGGGNGSILYTINTQTGMATEVGPTGQPLNGVDLAVDCEGNLFGITAPSRGSRNGRLFSVDKTTGLATPMIDVWSDLGSINTACLSWGPGEGCPPEVTCSLDCDTLWSPNHKFKNVGLDAEILSGRDIVSTTVTVYSDEPEEDQTGDGNHSPDAQDIGLGTLKLRKERKGDGDGRVYLIIISATDNLGRVGTECCTVTVTHDQSKASKASVADQAFSAELECMLTGFPPAGFVQIGN